MLRKSVVMYLCLSVLIAIPIFSLAEPISIKDNVLKLPAGSYISFSDGTFLNSASRLEGGIASNSEIVSCFGVTECYCPVGKVVKAALSVKCQDDHVLNGTYLLDAGATGWGADCYYMVKDYSYLNITNPPTQYVSNVRFMPSASFQIYIACTTP